MSTINKRKLDNKHAKDEGPASKSSKSNVETSKMRNKTKNEILKCYEDLCERFNLLQIEYEKLAADKEIHDQVKSDLEEANDKLEEKLNKMERPFQDFSCTDCGYPCQSISDLGEHMYEFHKGEEWDEIYSCKYCEMKYPTKRDLMIHRKRSHSEKVNICKYFIKGTCHFEDRCWFKHVKDQTNSINLKCGFCGKQLESKSDLMNHIKQNHSRKVQMCKHIIAGNYCFHETNCWFKHVEDKSS